jgi:hypothetical protein
VGIWHWRLFALALGITALIRGHSWAPRLLGLYLLSLALNYLPLFLHAIALSSRRNRVLSGAIEIQQPIRDYQIQSLLLLVPAIVPVLALVQVFRDSRNNRS